MAKTYTFVLSDESVNSYGTRILTDGINVEEIEKNPVMLYLHIRGYERTSGEPLLPIGYWENFRKENGQLLADAVFDEDDEFAIKIMKKVEKKILRAVSLGMVDIIEMSEDPTLMIPGQRFPTITKCCFYEISICDIGSNKNALRKLSKFRHNGQLINLSDGDISDDQIRQIFSLTHKKTNESSMKSLIAKLNTQGMSLSDTANESEVLSALEKVLSNKATELSQKETTITELTTQVKNLQKEKQDAIQKAIDDKALALVDGAIAVKKITAGEKEHYLTLAKASYDATKAILDSKTPYRSAIEQITGDGVNDDDGDDTLSLSKKWDEFHKSGKLLQLKDQKPDEYKKLFRAKYGKDPK